MTALATQALKEIRVNPKDRDNIICNKLKNDCDIEKYLRDTKKWRKYKKYSDKLCPAYNLMIYEITRKFIYKTCEKIKLSKKNTDIKELKIIIDYLKSINLYIQFSTAYNLYNLIENNKKDELIKLCEIITYKKPVKHRARKRSIIEQFMNS